MIACQVCSQAILCQVVQRVVHNIHSKVDKVDDGMNRSKYKNHPATENVKEEVVVQGQPPNGAQRSQTIHQLPKHEDVDHGADEVEGKAKNSGGDEKQVWVSILILCLVVQSTSHDHQGHNDENVSGQESRRMSYLHEPGC